MNWYFQLNLSLLAFGALALLLPAAPLSARQRVKIHLALAAAAMLSVLAAGWLPEQDYDFPQRQVLNAPVQLAMSGTFRIHEQLEAGPLGTAYNPDFLWAGLYLIIFLSILMLLLKTWKTWAALSKSVVYKRVGHVSLLVGSGNQSPYCFSLCGRSWIVLPEFLLSDTRGFRVATQHEIQHLRHGDTLWVYVFELVSIICFLNPIVWLWKCRFSMDQEFACDEALISSNKVSKREYASCLFRVAETTASQSVPFGATGMAWGQNQLLRRIVQMKHIREEAAVFYRVLLGFVLVFFAASVVALQSSTAVVSAGELKKTVNVDDFNGFPIDINESVATELNRFLSNSKWREFTRDSLKRYEGYKALINSKAEKYQLPREIAAVAFIESGFQNLPDRTKSISSQGAGMWQFIASTARAYGLEVSETVDERLHVAKATDAALRYLASNKELLGDLRLALMAYYVGESRVQMDMEQFGTRDPWVLIENGRYKTPYLARSMAAAILLKYPSLLD